MKLFLSGVFTALALVVALFFANFYRKTSERLFFCFSAAFTMLAIERIVIGVLEISNEQVSPVVYLLRLISLILILAAIIDKNQRSEKGQ